MQEKRQVILYLLLVALSPVKASDFAYSTSAYQQIQSLERVFYGNSFKEAKPFKFLQMGYDEEMKVAPKELLEGVPYKGLYMILKDLNKVYTILSNGENQSGELEFFDEVSIIFRTILHPNGQTTFGSFTVSFQEDAVKPHVSYLIIHMFSAPRTEEDEKDAKNVTKELNPISQAQIDSILETGTMDWNFSCLGDILSDGVRKGYSRAVKKRTLYFLKPLIVNDGLLQQYYNLAGASENVRSMDPPQNHWDNPVRLLQNRERGHKRGNWWPGKPKK